MLVKSARAAVDRPVTRALSMTAFGHRAHRATLDPLTRCGLHRRTENTGVDRSQFDSSLCAGAGTVGPRCCGLGIARHLEPGPDSPRDRAALRPARVDRLALRHLLRARPDQPSDPASRNGIWPRRTYRTGSSSVRSGTADSAPPRCSTHAVACSTWSPPSPALLGTDLTTKYQHLKTAVGGTRRHLQGGAVRRGGPPGRRLRHPVQDGRWDARVQRGVRHLEDSSGQLPQERDPDFPEPPVPDRFEWCDHRAEPWRREGSANAQSRGARTGARPGAAHLRQLRAGGRRAALRERGDRGDSMAGRRGGAREPALRIDLRRLLAGRRGSSWPASSSPPCSAPWRS